MSNFKKLQHYLPDIIIEIAELIGFPLTEKLVKTLGGLQFSIVKNISSAGHYRYQLLVDAIGDDAAEKIIKRFGGDSIYIPRCDLALRKLRNTKFLQELDFLVNSGLSVTRSLDKLCPQYGFSSRFARRIIAQYNQPFKNIQQHTLF